MAQLLVRNLDDRTLERLKSQARRQGRSLQGEAKALLEAGAAYSPEEFRAATARWQKHFQGRRFSSSAALIRKDRLR